MRWLKRAHNDDGVTLVLVAISMVALIALVGLAIDGAALFSERRQLSRGADAAALAVAEDCVLEVKPCDDDQAWTTADEYADVNADDGASAIAAVDLDTSAGTVHVRTKSFDPEDGTDTFKYLFMRVVGIDSSTVVADATAQWGVASGGSAFPIIVSGCEWAKYGLGGTDFPGYGVPITLTFHDGNGAEECNAQAGQDADGDGFLAGGFGWLETYGDCIADVENSNWYAEEPGNSPPNGCSTAEFRALVYDKDVVVPVFDDADGITGNGATGRYRIHALAAFHVTGYNFRGQYVAPSGFRCSEGDQRCIEGYFVADLVIYDGTIGTGGDPDYGVYIIKLIG
jgi:Flp pilus assembly protein TadG